jgi:hypothetical protein
MSQSSLIPEHPLLISPSLAATIGLEEAVLLKQLSELVEHRSTISVQGYKWLDIDRLTPAAHRQHIEICN